MTKRRFAAKKPRILTEDDPRLGEELRKRMREMDRGEVELVSEEEVRKLLREPGA